MKEDPLGLFKCLTCQPHFHCCYGGDDTTVATMIKEGFIYDLIIDDREEKFYSPSKIAEVRVYDKSPPYQCIQIIDCNPASSAEFERAGDRVLKLKAFL